MKIAVAGATGRVGRHVVDILSAAGHEVVPMSRGTGVDVTTGAGLDAALEGVECIIDAATGPSPDQEQATAFFTASARNLQAAGARAGVQRIVVVSIIGIERYSGGYNAAKVAHEQALLAGPLPVRILRASQFHEFVAELLAWGTQGDIAYLPNMRTQLVAARSVAQALADLAISGESTGTSEIAGPREESLLAAATLVAAKRGAPQKVARATGLDPDSELMEQGAALPNGNALLTGPTFEEWLDATN
ncbi:SDR family oxidoreductase [Antrihabitans sp. YC2-6]|uniref:SDR family oxidoreductase n=1 Tax=Antrihabitans sp. YC2-6 TaxID=2799498 RepID=UPI0018F586BB|nr:NAD(P)H-binding protein [Antrihabitans sp. YC2-6]MBJ8345572.1 NAD(P)H-binding protein [Antrihabitans sp. YC2-6]